MIKLRKAYYQIPVADIPKAAITTTIGLFEFKQMPLPLKNAAQTFQHFMDQIFTDVSWVIIYLDDILVFSSDADEHLKVSIEKCQFLKHEVNFLDYTISESGI